jgi:hypothetical protein
LLKKPWSLRRTVASLSEIDSGQITIAAIDASNSFSLAGQTSGIAIVMATENRKEAMV